MSSETTSDEESSQEDFSRYEIEDLEMIKTIGKRPDFYNMPFF